MNKKPLYIDEREKENFRKICTTLYIITLFVLMGMQLYRQFVLGQPAQEWDDIALLLTVNVLVLLGALLYMGGAINPLKINANYLLGGYAGFVAAGFLWTIIKYKILLKQELVAAQIFNYFGIVAVISGILALLLGLFAFLGSKKIDETIE